MLAMEKGGSGMHSASNYETSVANAQLRSPDVIELGVPFTDPIADGPTIQTANTVRVCPSAEDPTSLRVDLLTLSRLR